MGLKEAAFKGAYWSTIGSVATASIQIIRPAILTRFLEKSDFGLMAILMLVLGFTQIFSDLGVSVALFSNKHISKREYSSLYWVGILTGLFLYLIVVITAPLTSSFYNLPQLTSLMPLIGLDLIISVAGRQFQVFRQMDLEFKSLAIINICSAVVSFIFAVGLAYNGYGIYSLIFSALAASTFKTGALIISGIKSHPISFCIDIRENKKFYKIGLYQTGAQVLDYLASQVDIIIIGKIMSTSDLGVYNLLKQLVLRPYGLINSIVTTVSIPLLASSNDQLLHLKKNYLQLIRLVGFINIPLYTLIALFSKELILLIYGAAYVNASPYLQVLCLWGAGAAITNAASTLIVVRGRTDLGFVWTIIRILTNPVFIFIGSFFGLTGIVWANSIGCLIYVLFYHKFLVSKILREVSMSEYISTYLDLFVLCVSAFMLLFFLKENVAVGLNPWIQITTFLSLFVVIYLSFNLKQVTLLKSFMSKKKLIES